MWQILMVYGVGGKLLKTVQSFYLDRRASIRVGIDVGESFPVKWWIETRLCDVSSLFNVYIDGVVREVNARVHGERQELLSVNRVRFDINLQLFAADKALMADSEEKLCRLVNVFERVCEL